MAEQPATYPHHQTARTDKMLTDNEKEDVYEHGRSRPVKVSDGWALLIPCVNDDFEIDICLNKELADEGHRYYWGAK